MDKLSEVAATLKTQGVQLCYDSVAQKAFVITEQDKKSIAQRLKVYSNKLEVEKTIDLPKGVHRAIAQGGYMLCSSLNDLYLYGCAENVEQISTRHFENLAPRDFALTDEYVIATFVDQQSKGFMLVLSKDQKDMRVMGSVDIPHDGTAASCARQTSYHRRKNFGRKECCSNCRLHDAISTASSGNNAGRRISIGNHY